MVTPVTNTYLIVMFSKQRGVATEITYQPVSNMTITWWAMRMPFVFHIPKSTALNGASHINEYEAMEMKLKLHLSDTRDPGTGPN